MRANVQRSGARESGSRRAAVAACVASVCMLLASVATLVFSGVAVAETGHGFLASLSEGPAGHPLGEPGAVAVDHATNEVFFADSDAGVIDVFDSSGAFEMQFGEGLEAAGVAVDEATGDVYVAESAGNAVLVFARDGSGGYGLLSRWTGAGVPGGRFGAVRGVAVDNSTSLADPAAGDVYVVDGESVGAEGGAVDVFKPEGPGPEEGSEGELLRVLAGAKLDQPNGVAVDATTGGVFVADNDAGAIYRYDEMGSFEAKLKGSGSLQAPLGGKEKDQANVTAIAVDETTGDLLVSELERDVVGELDQAGEWVGSVTSTPSGPFGQLAGVAVTATGNVYVADSAKHVLDVFGSSVQLPDVFTLKPAKLTETTATLKGTVDGDGKPMSYHFELGESEAYATLSTPVQEDSSGNEQQVEAPVSGLKPGTKYFFRLIGQNENGVSCSGGRIFATAGGEPANGSALSLACQRPGASIDGESVTEVGENAATLDADINPLGHETTYEFLYGPESCQANPTGCTSIPQPSGDAASGETDVNENATIAGLQPDTTYHYRVIATNSQGTNEGTEHTFTTRAPAASFALLDSRSWELVSPPDKHGAPVEALTREGGVIRAAENGDAITYVADGAITTEPQGVRSPEMQQVISTRGTEGWTSQDIVTPQTKAQGVRIGAAPEYQFFTPNLSVALVEPWGTTPLSEPPLAPEATQKTIYLRDDPPLQPDAQEAPAYQAAQRNGEVIDSPGYLPLVTEANAPGAAFGGQFRFVGATPDLSHIVLKSNVGLAGPSSKPGLYEWAAGNLQLVSVLPSGLPAVEPELGYFTIATNAVSGDGSRVIWTTREENAHRGHLYMRDTVTGNTLQLDAAQGEPEAEHGTAEFQAASSDGSRVFFTDKQRLTEDSTAEPGEENTGKPDLYECEITEEAGELRCDLKDLSVDHRTGEHADVQGLVFGASEDGSTVYFIAHGVLASNRNGNSEGAEAGANNLYEAPRRRHRMGDHVHCAAR